MEEKWVEIEIRCEVCGRELEEEEIIYDNEEFNILCYDCWIQEENR